MGTINLNVSGMTCGACVKHVEKAINAIAGVMRVEVGLASGVVEVEVEGDVSQGVKELIAALEEEGYRAQVSAGTSSEARDRSCKSGVGCCCN